MCVCVFFPFYMKEQIVLMYGEANRCSPMAHKPWLWVGFGFLATQAQELIEDAKTVNDVPFWCYGLVNSRSN